MEGELVVALELRGELLQELAVGVEARHLVLVLVGHQLVERFGDGLGESGTATGLVLLDLGDLVDEGAVARGIGFVLVIGQELDALGNDLR